MDYSLQGLNNHISSAITSQYWLNKIYTPGIKKAHENGSLHIHDLSLLACYCVGWDLQDFLRNGFKGVGGKVESGPPKHLGSALGQIVNFFYTLQGETAGAQAFSNFDTLLAPFIRHDNLNFLEVKQLMQEFIFNINIPTRVGFQTPFTNIAMDMVVPSIFQDQAVIIGGIEQEYTYSKCQYQMDMLNTAFAEVMLAGDAKGRVFTFPIPTYNITKDFNWAHPNFKTIWKMTAKYGTPYFANFVNSDMNSEDIRSMCCRLQIDNRELFKRGGGLFGANPLTGSIGVVTINLPQIGYLSDHHDDFFLRLSEQIKLAKESLIIKRKVLESFTDKGLFPYSKHYLKDIKASGQRKQYWANHFSTIGVIGMNEVCLNMIGFNIAHKEGQKFSLDILRYIRLALFKAQKETGDLFNLEATPAEGATYRLAKLDKANYPDIICANNENNKELGGDDDDDNDNDNLAPYYTNSSHLPVNYTDDIFEVLELQDDLQTQYTGGTVLHIYLGEEASRVEPGAIKNLIKKITSNYKLPYFTITPTFSVCPQDGYISGKHKLCNKCGSETEVYSRVVGYLRPVKQWNNGKQAEFKDRKSFKLELRKEGNYYHENH